VEQIRAKVIVPGSNIPFTVDIANRLSARGIGVVPDFVANGGGVLAALAEIQGLDVAGAFASVRDRITVTTVLVLRRSQEQQCRPFAAALLICQGRWQRTAPGGRDRRRVEAGGDVAAGHEKAEIL
jgi:glutamate dehydrogenase/leucine dehydrogenase